MTLPLLKAARGVDKLAKPVHKIHLDHITTYLHSRLRNPAHLVRLAHLTQILPHLERFRLPVYGDNVNQALSLRQPFLA